MARHHHVQHKDTFSLEDACVDAFRRGNKREAVQLLPRTVQSVAHLRTDKSLLLCGESVSLLHCAAYHGWKDVVCELVTRYNCEVNFCDSNGQTALHYAARRGHLELLSYLITKHHCQATLQDKYGWTPLHLACANGHIKITQYLITEHNCDPSCENNFGDTPLHMACLNGHAHIVQLLLSTRSVDPNSSNMLHETPLDMTTCGSNSYEILKVFQQSQQCRKEFPVHLFSKAILTGNSAAGKSSLAKVITRIATRSAMASVLDKVTSRKVEVECLTAGITPLYIESKDVGHMILYDFAGQPEFYSSHFAVMENAMQRSAAIFINMVDLSKSEREITREVHYWLNFIENASCKIEEKLCVVMVGSHADMLNKAQLESKSTLVTELVQRRVKRLEYIGFVALDCRQVNSKGARKFVSLLSKSQQTIAAHATVMSFYCHLLYAFLQNKLKRTACKLQDLISALAAEKDSSVPRDMHFLCDHLISLSDKGLIIFLQNHQNPEKSWVVVEKVALLKEVNGTLFSPREFKQHRQIASNTGIVPVSSLAKLFPQHDAEMLVGFLESLEFCHLVNLSDTITNLNAAIPASPPSCVGSAAEPLLFFPSLVQVERADTVTSGEQLSFGWCLVCKDPYQFFTPRFFHVLLLNLAYTYPLASRHIPASSPLHGLEQKCVVWKNGISWSDEDGIKTVVELIGQNQWVVVAMSHNKDRPVEHATLCSALISLVIHLQQKHCPSVDTCECLISPSLVQQYPFSELPDMNLFAIKDVARSILLHKPFIVSVDGSGRLPTKMSSEPYYFLSSSSVCQLVDSSMAEQPVPACLLQEVCRHCQQPQLNPEDHKSLRACVDKMSIFCGRNPLEIAGLSCNDVLSQVAGATPGCAPTTVQLLLSAVRSVSDWHQLGVMLGLEMSQLHEIEQNYHVGGVSRMKSEMMSLWLRSTPGASWEELVTALEEMGEKVLAREVVVSYCGRSLTTGMAPLETRATECHKTEV